MVESYDIPTIELVPECSICKHPIALKGDAPQQQTLVAGDSRYWECDHKCRCLISGCVPKAAKYGTA